MHLGKFNKILASYRRDKSVFESVFMNKLINAARISSEKEDNCVMKLHMTHITKSSKFSDSLKPDDLFFAVYHEQADYKRNKYRNVFSTSLSRTPIPFNTSRSILAQKDERYFILMDFLMENIDDGTPSGENILMQIEMDDNTSIIKNSRRLGGSVNGFLNDFMSVDTEYDEDYRRLAVFKIITDYFYYSVLWNLIEYSIPGIYNITQPFSIYLDELEYFITASHFKANNIILSDDRAVIYNMSHIVIMDLNNAEHSSERIVYRLPYSAWKISFKKICLSDEYFLILFDSLLVIYKYGVSDPYRCIYKSEDYPDFINARFTDDDRIAVYCENCRLMTCCMDELRPDQEERERKNSVVSEFEEISRADYYSKGCSAQYARMTKEKAVFYYAENQYILSMDDITNTKRPVFGFSEKNCRSILVSPNERYLAYKTVNSRREEYILVDSQTNRNFLILDTIQSNFIEDIRNFFSGNEENSKSDKMDNYVFSPDDRLFVYSVICGSDNHYVTNIIDLESGSPLMPVENTSILGFSADGSRFYLRDKNTVGSYRIIPYSVSHDGDKTTVKQIL